MTRTGFEQNVDSEHRNESDEHHDRVPLVTEREIDEPGRKEHHCHRIEQEMHDLS